MTRKSLLFLLIFTLVFFTFSQPSRAENGMGASDVSNRIDKLIKRATAMETQQEEILDRQESIIETIKGLKIWINKQR
jgi:hypothetical protein